MKKFKGLNVPEITTTKREKLCNAIRESYSCVDVECDKCVYSGHNYEEYNEYLKSNNK
jgi:hypothetical protein